MAIAETVGGSESGFVARMNAEASRLGMASTVFRNPNGLPNEAQVTTARDLAVLTRAIWVEFPEHRELFKIPAIKAGKKILRSHNTLLERFRGANGMKTGYICASGFNIVATATRSGRTLAVVVLGADSAKDRAELAAKLLQDGFRPRIFGGDRPALAGFRATRSPGPAVNMKQQVCGKRQKREGEDEPQLAGVFNRSALEPRFVLMAPVPVTTGVPAKKKDAVARPSRSIPIPRPRPPMPGDSATIIDPLVDEVARALRQTGGASLQ
jgi:D-alanyl-D-alanine carboxypeptidase